MEVTIPVRAAYANKKSRRQNMDYNRNILPFYLAYPAPSFGREEDNALRDLEYLQQIYPAEAKKVQRRIAEILDKMDYEGSMIYDEYPDRWQLYRLAENIVIILKNEEQPDKDGKPIPPEKWEWMGDMVQILLYYEIYKRRHGRKRGFIKF